MAATLRVTMLYKQLEQTAKFQHRKCAGKPPVSEVVDQVRELFTRSPGKSTPRANFEYVIPRLMDRLKHFAKKKHKLHIYTIVLLHEMKSTRTISLNSSVEQSTNEKQCLK